MTKLTRDPSAIVFDRSDERVKQAEMRQFFRELADSTLHLLSMYEDDSIEKPIQRLKKLKDSCASDVAVRIGHVNPRYLAWSTLNNLAESGNPELAAELWASTMNHAADSVLCADAAYDAIKSSDDSPFEKAQFMARVSDFASAWHPSGGIEWTLIGQLAQSQVLYERWLRKHVDRMNWEGIHDSDVNDQLRRSGSAQRLTPRISEVEAIEQAQQMADRYQKMMLRTIRALRDLRRYSSTVVIQNAEQVNVGEQQINVQSH